jgi:Protein of unknown function (DUF2844)
VYGPSALLLTVALAVAAPAWAVLGEDLASVHADQLRLGAARHQQVQLTMQVHVLSLPDGSSIRQYATPDGRVFAVSWNTRFKPRLDQLLGRHFATYAEGGRLAQAQRPGVAHSARIARGDLVVETVAHLQAHVGRAYLRSQLPAGTAPDALR